MNNCQNTNLDKVAFGISTNVNETTSKLRLNKQVIGGIQNGGNVDINALAFSGSNASFCCATIPDPATDIKTLGSIGGFKCKLVRADINNYIRFNQNQ